MRPTKQWWTWSWQMELGNCTKKHHSLIVPSCCCCCSCCCCAQEIIADLIESALGHVSMRPSKAVVDLELAEWKAGQPAALAAISRHLADG
jgi:hypothetical protein